MKKKRLLVICSVVLLVLGNIFFIKEILLYIKKLAEKSYRLEVYYNMFNKWLPCKGAKRIGNYLVENKIHKIAIYGMGIFGIHLLNDLQDDNSINILYGIDRSVEKIDRDIKIYKPDDCLPQVDAVIVTAIFSFREIKEKLQKKMDCPIISLEEIIKDI